MAVKKDISKDVLKIVDERLRNNGYTIQSIDFIDYGIQVRTLTGCIINIYNSGKMVFQGTKDEELIKLLK